MDSNNLVSAPCVPDMQALYAAWSETHSGDFNAFMAFMEEPGPERESFLTASAGFSTRYSRGVFMPVYKN